MNVAMDTMMGCRGCDSLQDEIKKVKEEYALNFTTIKQKIISTDKLIRQYSSKCQELDTQTKKVEDIKNKLNLLQKDNHALQMQLQTALQQVGSLKQELSESKESKAKISQEKLKLEEEHGACRNLFHQLENRLQEKDELEGRLNDQCRKLKQDLEKTQKVLAKQEKCSDKLKETLEINKQQLQEEKKSKKSLQKQLEGAEKLLKKYEHLNLGDNRKGLKRQEEVWSDCWSKNEQFTTCDNDDVESRIFSELKSVIQFSATELPTQLMPLPISPVSSCYDSDEELDAVCSEIDQALDSYSQDLRVTPSSDRDHNESSLLCDFQDASLLAENEAEESSSDHQDISKANTLSETTNKDSDDQHQNNMADCQTEPAMTVSMPSEHFRCSTPKMKENIDSEKNEANIVSTDTKLAEQNDTGDEHESKKQTVDIESKPNKLPAKCVAPELSDNQARGAVTVSDEQNEHSKDTCITKSGTVTREVTEPCTNSGLQVADPKADKVVFHAATQIIDNHNCDNKEPPQISQKGDSNDISDQKETDKPSSDHPGEVLPCQPGEELPCQADICMTSPESPVVPTRQSGEDISDEKTGKKGKTPRCKLQCVTDGIEREDAPAHSFSENKATRARSQRQQEKSDGVKVESAEVNGSVTKKRPYTRSQSRDSSSDERTKKRTKKCSEEEESVENQQDSTKNVHAKISKVQNIQLTVPDATRLSNNEFPDASGNESSPGVVTRARARLCKSKANSLTPESSTLQCRKRTVGEVNASTCSSASKKTKNKIVTSEEAVKQETKSHNVTQEVQCESYSGDNEVFPKSQKLKEGKNVVSEGTPLSPHVEKTSSNTVVTQTPNCTVTSAETDTSQINPTAFDVIHDMAQWDLTKALSPLPMSPVHEADTPDPEMVSPTISPLPQVLTLPRRIVSPCQFKATAPKDAISVTPYPLSAARNLLQALEGKPCKTVSISKIADRNQLTRTSAEIDRTEKNIGADIRQKENSVMNSNVNAAVKEDTMVGNIREISKLETPSVEKASCKEREFGRVVKEELQAATKASEGVIEEFDLADYDTFDDDSVKINSRNDKPCRGSVDDSNKPIGDVWGDIASDKVLGVNNKRKKKKSKKKKKKGTVKASATSEGVTPFAYKKLGVADDKLNEVLHKIKCMAEVKAVNAVVAAVIQYTTLFAVDLMPVIATKCWNNNNNPRPVLTPQEESIAAALTERLSSLPSNVHHGILKGLHKGVMIGSDLMQCLSLCRIYVGLSRLLNCKDGICVLCYDMFQQNRPDVLHHLLAIVGVWPALLRKHGNGVQPVINALEFVTQKKLSVVSDQQQKVVMEKYLSLMCGWQIGKQTAEKISEVLLNEIKHKVLVLEQNNESMLTAVGFEIAKAMELVAQYQGWEWTNNWLIREAFWPILREWSQKLKDDLNTNCSRVIMLFHIIKEVSVIGLAANKSSVVELLKMLCSVLAQTSIPWAVQCSLARCILYLAISDPPHGLMALQTWQTQAQKPIGRDIKNGIEKLKLCVKDKK